MHGSFRLESAPKTSAWYDWNEWEYVFQLLFGFEAGSYLTSKGELVHSSRCCLATGEVPSVKDIFQLNTGIQRIKTWSKRTRIPAAVESTAALIEVVLKDIVSDPSLQLDIPTSVIKDDPVRSSILSLKEDRSETEKRLLYSMTIIRFVNLHAEQELKNHGIVRPLVEVAESIGLPVTFVELRHEATHGELPSIHSLRVAARQAIDWLQSHYWNIQRDSHREKIKETWSLLADYVKCTMGHAMDQSMGIKAAKVMLQEAPKIITTPSLVVDVLIPLLLEGFLIPRKLKKLLEKYQDVENFNPNNLIPSSYVECWHLALKTFHKTFANFTSSLVVAIVQKLFRTEESHHETHETNSPLPSYNIHTSLKKIIQTLEGADHSIERFLHGILTKNSTENKDAKGVLSSFDTDSSDLNTRHKDLKCAFLMTWFSLLLTNFNQWKTNIKPFPIPLKMLLQTAIQHSHSKWSRSVVDKIIKALLESKSADFVVTGSHLQSSLQSLQQLNETIYQNTNNNNHGKQLSIEQFEELEESNWHPIQQRSNKVSRKRRWIEIPISANWVDPIGWIPESHYDGNSTCLALPSVLNHFSKPVRVSPSQEAVSEQVHIEDTVTEELMKETEVDPNAVDLDMEEPSPKNVKMQKQASGKGVRILFSMQEIGVV